jgi:hypothetical protein
MKATFVVASAVIVMASAWPAAAESAFFDRSGRLISLVYSGDELTVRGRVQIPSPDGSRMGEPVAATTRGADRTSYQGVITTEPGKTARVRQTAIEEGGRIWISVDVTADVDLDVAGVYYTIDVPRTEFAGGQATVQTAAGARTAALPPLKPAERDFFRAEGSALLLAGAVRNLMLSATLDGPHSIALADRWDRTGRTYAAMIQIRPGPLAAGQTASIKLGLALTGEPDRTPANLKVDTATKRYSFQGVGGNYCFNIESPVAQYTLNNLKVAWGRTEMSLSYWEPDEHAAAPADIDYFKQREQAYPRLRLEMQMGKQLQDKGIPFVASVWAIPEWAYTDPGPAPRRANRRHIAPDKMEELVNSIVSYLRYARQQYGAEPDLFSFNEANIGVDVLLTPEEHRDMIKRLGAAFEEAGLKTRLLLGDATGPRNTHEFVLAAAQDPEAMKYVKAVGFHSWGGGTPEQYKAWGDLAEWLQLPLLVTELGVDAQAYQGGMYDSFRYGMSEVRMYQELLLYARPQATEQWEFTADYGMVHTARRADGSVDLVPTSRFWLVKHFTDLTPHNSDVLATASDNDKVLLTAFAQGPAGRRIYTLHVANMAAARQVAIEGMPDAEFRAVRTGENENFLELPAMRPQGGVLRFEIPARSLLTLTTMPR